MKTLHLLQAGLGNVGRALLGQIMTHRNMLKERFNLELIYCGLFNSKHGVFNPQGLTKSEIAKFPNGGNCSIQKAIESAPEQFILIDITNSDHMHAQLLHALKRGGYVVLSNKRPLASILSEFKKLHSYGSGRLLFETTVGAGLPVIRTLKTLLATGDEIIEIIGCMSGTLGYICSSIEDGVSFSESVNKAKTLGYTEFDPREDLSGADVARKALILARLCGLSIEMKNIKLRPLYPSTLSELTVEEFMENVSQLDSEYQSKANSAKKRNKTLRFVATISKESISVGLREVSLESDVGSLKGSDNIFVFKTKQYCDRPLVLKGPGAGPDVTSAGVFGDILQIAGVV